MATISELDRFKILCFELLCNEEKKALQAIEASEQALRYFPKVSYYITRYYEAVRRYEDFKIFERKLYEVLEWL